MNEDLLNIVKKANRYRDIVAMMLLGLFLQMLLNWSVLWGVLGIWHFFLTGLFFFIGGIFYLDFIRRMRRVENLHDHMYDDHSLFCKECGKYWNLKSCLYCNSKNIKIVREADDFQHFEHDIYSIECKDCGKSKKIDSFTSMHVKKSKLEVR